MFVILFSSRETQKENKKTRSAVPFSLNGDNDYSHSPTLAPASILTSRSAGKIPPCKRRPGNADDTITRRDRIPVTDDDTDLPADNYADEDGNSEQ